MRRPRHREKSNLLYKMLGIAALAGLSLAPILIGLGALKSVPPLIPVQLVTVTPPPPPVVPPKPAQNRSAPVPRSERPVRPRPERVALVPPSHTKMVRAIGHQSAPPPTVKTPPKPAVAHAVPDNNSERLAREVRKAKADRLEKQAHEIAVALAARRAKEASAAHARLAAAHQAAIAIKPPAKPTRVAVHPHPTPPKHPVQVASQSDGNSGPQTHTPPTTLTPTEANPPPQPPIVAPSVVSDYVPAEVVFQAQPTVPDRMLVAPLHAVFRCRFLIHADGSATVLPLVSTGHPELDRRALKAARQWRFRPARQGGKPVESRLNVAMTFNVRAAT